MEVMEALETLPKPNNENIRTIISLGKLRIRGRISKQEFSSRCAAIICKNLQDLQHKMLPEEPEELRDYKNLDKTEQEGMKDKIFKYPKIKQYLEEKGVTKNDNYRKYCDLAQLKRILLLNPHKNQLNLKEIDELITEHDQHILRK